MTRILIVDDEPDLCDILQFNLQSEGFATTCAYSAEEALELLDRQTFNLILLDVMMDRMSGIELAQQLRNHGNNTPIIFLTAKDRLDDQLAGFAAGGDDYITKPFAFDMVLARVRAVMKRTATSPTPSVCQVGELEVNLDTHLSSLQGVPLELTKREQVVLELLARRSGEFLPREEILACAWPDDILVNDRTVDVHIARLRKKMGDYGSLIVNKTGYGYTLKKPET